MSNTATLQFSITDGFDTWDEHHESLESLLANLKARTANEAGFDGDMPLCAVTYEVHGPEGAIIGSAEVDYRQFERDEVPA